jgi:ABC-type multidrug transport system, ATPase component
MERLITFDNVSKFYGESLGVNRVTLSIGPGITSLVGPNGAGKTTLMNLIAGVLTPSGGSVHVLGSSPADAEEVAPLVGYCTQFDSFPKGFTGYDIVECLLTLHGYSSREASHHAMAVLAKVGLTEAAHRKIAAYSKGMRQRVKFALAIAHDPQVLILDEPLNGLDPMARAEVIELFRNLATAGRHVIISSHILHEVDVISDRVVMLSNGYVVAEGGIRDVRSEIEDHPMQILIRCDRPAVIASHVFTQDSVVEVKIHADNAGLVVSTKNPKQFYRLLNRIILDNDLSVEAVAPADENVHSVYEYLLGGNGTGRS